MTDWAAQKCRVILNMIDLINSFLGKKDQLTCAQSAICGTCSLWPTSSRKYWLPRLTVSFNTEDSLATKALNHNADQNHPYCTPEHLVCKNPRLAFVDFYYVSNRVGLQDLAQAMQNC
ncbi:hypothetical protein BGZ81_007613 [Podila clonocystis]|nr:hypothetical protein BGZ81_007613 [Podila clonocystis]